MADEPRRVMLATYSPLPPLDGRRFGAVPPEELTGSIDGRTIGVNTAPELTTVCSKGNSRCVQAQAAVID
ncbi:uncharacterized protein LOC100793487 [Anopheles sinensis]|uniref:Uncharacterized protein LOC100793487 n=1 Tax=Anopheles sinensis TaxID=74873 RepID=A0A084VEB5_ANOSI|nr:uncharacterized protein LOC100793487 [Anopheles sinensis]